MNSKNETNSQNTEVRVDYVSVIKELMLEKLTEWDKSNLYIWLKKQLEVDKDLVGLLFGFSTTEILNTLSPDSIVDYLAQNYDKFSKKIEILVESDAYKKVYDEGFTTGYDQALKDYNINEH